MITSQFPVWRTNPAGFGIAGYWPILTGALAVLVGAPLVGAFLSLFAQMQEPDSILASIAIVLVFSFFITWAPLLVAIPISAVLATRGFAGWGIAILGGFFGGAITYLALEGGPNIRPEAIALPLIGVFFASVYWLAIRLIHPATLGVALTPAP